MKIIKNVNSTKGGYKTNDDRFTAWRGYPALDAARMFWIVDEKGDNKTKYFKTLNEVKEYIASKYE